MTVVVTAVAVVLVDPVDSDEQMGDAKGYSDHMHKKFSTLTSILLDFVEDVGKLVEEPNVKELPVN